MSECVCVCVCVGGGGKERLKSSDQIIIENTILL